MIFKTQGLKVLRQSSKQQAKMSYLDKNETKED